MTDVRGYTTEARSTDTFGRVLISSRDQHLVVDGPVENGCPGEAVTPPELFLAGVASCGVELLQVIARDRDVALGRIAVRIEGTIDRSEQPRSDVTVFSAVRMSFELEGVDEDDAAMLVKTFKGR